MKIKDQIWVVGLVVMAIILPLQVGCANGTGNSLNKAEFIRQGNNICQKGEQEREAAFAEQVEQAEGQKVTQQIKEEAVLSIFRPYELMIRRLTRIGLPEGDEEDAEAVIDAMEQAVSDVQENPANLLSSDLPVRKANELATSYGLDKCIY